jgi:protein TonB
MLPHPLSRSAPGANDPPPLPDLAHLLTQHAAAGFPPDLALDLVLNELVVRAADATHATAAALALVRGDQMVCRAATGRHAPDLGTPLDTSDGLSGACLRARAAQLSSDTESDPRVDPTISRRLGIRSMLIVPVFESEFDGEFDGDPNEKLNGGFKGKSEGAFSGKQDAKFDGKSNGEFEGKPRAAGQAPRLTGVLEVFSPLPNTFSHPAQALLADFADECARICRAAAQLSTRPPAAIIPLDEELISSDTENIQASAATEAAAEDIPTEEMAMSHDATYAEFSELVRNLTNHKDDHNADRINADHIGDPKKDDDDDAAFTPEPELLPPPSIASSRTSSGRTSSTPTPSSLANEAPLALSRPYRQPYEVWTLTLGALVILAAAAFSFMIGSRVGWLRSPQPAAPSSASAPADAPIPSGTATPAKASSPSNRDSSKSKAAPHAPSNSASGSPAGSSSAAASPADELVIYDKNKVVFRMKPVPAKTPASSADAAQKPATQNSTRAASLAPSGGSHPASNTQSASGAVWLAPSQAESRLMSRVEPQYPADALAAHRSGNVTLEVHVAADGTVAAVRTLNGDPLLAAAAEQAVRSWRYHPYRPNEKPSAFQTDVTLTFSLPN